MQSNHLILCRPLLLPPSMFPSIRVFSDESVLMRCCLVTKHCKQSKCPFMMCMAQEWLECGKMMLKGVPGCSRHIIEPNKKARVRYSERIALKQVYYQGWNRTAARVGCMRQVLGAGALGWPRGMEWGENWEEGSGWGTHVNPRLIHVNVWQKPLQYCKVISLQLIKIN